MGEEAESCPQCGGRRLVRLVSRFALVRGEESRMEHLADDPALAGVDESDPKSMARYLKRMGQEMGEEGGPEFDQAVEEMERGEAGEGDVDSGAADFGAGDRMTPGGGETAIPQKKRPARFGGAVNHEAGRVVFLVLWSVPIGSVVFGSLLPAASPVMVAVGRLPVSDKVEHLFGRKPEAQPRRFY